MDVFATIAAQDLQDLQAALPAGYRARAFEDRDREVLVEIRNVEVHEIQRASAAEWRHWERLMPDLTQFRVVVEDKAGTVVAGANLSSGGVMRHPDGAVNGGVFVASAARGRGIGSALLACIEAEARRRSAPRLLSGASADKPAALAWAEKRGYREIGRRIESYVELASFDPAPFADAVARVHASGLRLASLAELLAGRDEAQREEVLRQVYEAEGEAWDDVPFPTPIPHWSYEHFRKTLLDERSEPELTVLAADGDRVASFTTTGRRGERDGHTYMTGTRRAYRGRGLALAVKVEALTRAKAKGLRALLTTNDEPNRAMRGINARLGYQPLAPHVSLEKRFA